MLEFEKRRNEVLELALGQIQDLVIFTDTEIDAPDGPHIVFVNKAVERLTGYSAGELLGMSPKVLQGPLTDRSALDRIGVALAKRETIQEEVINYSKDGETYWLEIIISPVISSNGAVTNFISIQRDITERKTAELKLNKLEQDYRFMFENVQSAVILHKANTEIVYANPMALELLGVDEDSVVGTHNSAWSFVSRDGSLMPQSAYPVNRAVAERTVIHGMVFGYRRSNEDKLVWGLCSAFPIMDDTGEVTEVLTSFTEITKLVEAEEQAEIFRERFELAAEATEDAIFEWNLETNAFWANAPFADIYGTEPPNELRLDSWDGWPTLEGDPAKVLQVVLNAIRSGDERYSLDMKFTRPDGAPGHTVTRGFIVRNSEGKALRIVGTSTDVKKLTEVTSALEHSETRFRIVADMVSDVLWDFDYETGESWMTPDWLQKLGVAAAPSDEMKGWFHYVDLADRERLLKAHRRALESDDEYWSTEYKLVGADGNKIDVVVNATILRNAEGKAYRMVGNVKDITAEKRRQEGFTRARALEAVGQLTGGVAHDFNNQLMIIQGNAELLEMGELDAEQKEAVALIHQASNSAAQLTRRLLSFSGQSQLSYGRVRLSDLISGTAILLQVGIPESITVHVDIPSDIWDVAVDANALEQALVNLAVNARDAMPKGGDIKICGENRAVSETMHPFDMNLEPGEYVVVSVVDNGEGMPPAVLSKVFEPFFTTKDVGVGTGLGLSTVYGFAKQSGGSATIYSEPGHGTTVNLYLPRYRGGFDEDVIQDSPEMSANTPVHQRILLVEDHEQVRDHVQKLLSKMGYSVTAANDGKEALEQMNSGKEFELLFTDIIMPGGMNGQELAKEAKKLDPRIKVLFTSGYPASAFKHLGLKEQEGLRLLSKPYRFADLQSAIADLLGN